MKSLLYRLFGTLARYHLALTIGCLVQARKFRKQPIRDRIDFIIEQLRGLQ